MLEQEAQRLGLRERALAFSEIASPQQMQIRGLIAFSLTNDHLTTGELPCNRGEAPILAWENLLEKT